MPKRPLRTLIVFSEKWPRALSILRITVLGCGGSGGTPLLGGPTGHGDWGALNPAEFRNRRTRSSIIVQTPESKRLLVDAGPDLRTQLLTNGVGRIDDLLLTHAHADHVMGLDEVRPLNRALGAAIPTHGTAVTLADVQQRFGYAFRPPTPGFFRPCLIPNTVRPGETVRMAGMNVELFSQDHRVMETLGLRVGRFAYSTDVVRLPEESLVRLTGLDTWVVGCFQRRPHPVHAHVDQVLEWVDRLRPRRTVLTHMGTDLEWSWMAANLPVGVEAAYDGMVLDVPVA